MTIDQAKEIDIADYLDREGYQPTKKRGKRYWYRSPLRDERTASFKVDRDKGKCKDYGSNWSGDIIDLVMSLRGLHTTSEALRYLEKMYEEDGEELRKARASPPDEERTTTYESETFSNVRFNSLVHPALVAYIERRGIDVRIARVYCCEVHYVMEGKNYFAIAFRNRIGGCEVRNAYFKGCVGHKDISIFRQHRGRTQRCYVFEGFMDFLSYLTLHNMKMSVFNSRDETDFVILNSVSNLNRAWTELDEYEYVHCFLDNDDAGRRCLYEIKVRYGDKVINESEQYDRFNDLNDYLTIGVLGIS